jgi:hypothetical protein
MVLGLFFDMTALAPGTSFVSPPMSHVIGGLVNIGGAERSVILDQFDPGRSVFRAIGKLPDIGTTWTQAEPSRKRH